MPIALVLFLLIDWLIGLNVFVHDLFRLSGIIVGIAELLILSILFSKVPQTLRVIWTRGLIANTNNTSTLARFSDFLDRFEMTLNRQLAALIGGAAFAIVVALSTYPVRYWIETGRAPYADFRQFFYLGSGGAILLEVLLAFFIGLLVWRFGVVMFFINKLSREFKLRILPKHPDRSGGLRPLGDLCFNSALVILVPAITLSIWVVVGSQPLPGFEVYALWSGIFRKWLIVLSIASAFLFIQPLYGIHRQMEKQKQEIQHEMDEVSRQIGTILLKLRTQAETFGSEERIQQLAQLEFLRKVYEENSQVPTWPFDLNIVLRLAAVEAIPVMSFVVSTFAQFLAIN